MMPGPVILAIDQGTTNTKALLVASDGSIVAQGSRAMRLDYPKPGWVEQSPTAIWDAVAGLIGDLTAAHPEAPVAAIAISNQRETVVLWDAATGQPLAPAILWQCTRSADRCAALRLAGHGEEIAERSGLGIDPLFPAAKIAWLLDAIPGARERAARGEIRAGTIDSWLLWNLTGGTVHATDHSNASRTQLFNLDTLAWDPELARLFDVPLAILPRILPSDGGFGTVTGIATLAPGTPVQVMLGDSHAALYAHGIDTRGRVKATIGTGSSLMAATGGRVRSSHGLSSTIAWSRRDGGVQHALEGNISVSGHAAAFATTLLGLADERALTELAATVSDSSEVCFVPALAGLGAPHWETGARGTLSGMTLATRPAHVARATLEAIALQIADVLHAIAADLNLELDDISVDGGATSNPMLVRLIADLTGRVVVRPEIAEASALGVARLAAEALKLACNDRIPAAERVVPTMASDERAAIRRRWRSAVEDVIASARKTAALSGE